MTKGNIFKVSGEKGPLGSKQKKICYPNTKYSPVR